MNRLKFLFFTLMVVVLASCSRDENTPSANEGYIDIQLTASGEMQEVASRAEESGVPEAGDFSLTIKNADGETIGSWEKFSEYDASTVVSVGEYTVSASYGDATAEGFDGLSYAGSSSANVTEGETTEVSVQCTINKARVSIAYTDAFKQYFSAYSASVTSSHSNKVSFAADETRAAYFVPGNLDVYLDVTRPGASEKTTLKVKTLAAEVKHEYRLTMDVDAGTSTLKITFNDDPENTQNVEFDVSDEALNAAPPVFMANGFTSESAIEVVEGGSVEGVLQAYLNASSGIASCTLATNSAALKALGWPESVDLVKMTAEQKQKMTDLGLIVKGLGDNLDKIAIVEFQNVVPNLYCTGEGNEDHTFTLTATDVFGKVTETPVVLKITSRNNGFAVNLPESVPYGSSKMSFTMTLEGDASKVKFYYFAFGALQQFAAENVSISSEGTTHNVTLTYPDPLIDTEAGVQLKAEYGSKAIEKTVKVDDPALTLSLKNGDADVWAKHVDFQVVASAKSRSSRTISASTVEIQHKDTDETWKKWENVSFDGQNGFVINGLTSNTSYTFRAVYCQREYSNEQTVKTEEELGLPNAGMEEWFSNKITEDGTNLSGNDKVYWNKWYPWNENDEKSKGWNTLNQTTTQYGAKPSTFLGLPISPYVGCCYTTNSGTIRTEDKNSGNYAALIRTVGWGKWNTANVISGRMGRCDCVTPGELYLGTYDVAGHQSKYGYAFISRPSAIQFMYKYLPKNSADWFEVVVEIKDALGNVLVNKAITKTGEASIYTSEKIELEYTVAAKAAMLSIIFKSSGNKNCWGANTDNLNPPPGSNLSDGEYVGSQLYIDDVELIYE